MKQNNLLPTKIPASQALNLAPWQLPTMETQEAEKPFELKLTKDSIQVVEEEIEAQTITLAELEKIREDAYKEGFEQGFTEGHEQGFNTGQKEGYTTGMDNAQADIQQQLTLLNHLKTALQNPISAQETQILDILTNLVRQCSEAVVRSELAHNEQHIVTAIKQALASLPKTSGDCHLLAHSQDIAVIEKITELQGFSILADDTIQPGGFKLASAVTVIDDTLEQRFEQISSTLHELISQQYNEKP